MKTACVFFLLAVGSALAMQIRQKRQSSQTDGTNNLEDRYGPWQSMPNGNNFPGAYPMQNQFQGQNPSPWQNQFPPQNQFQWQNQFPPQNQFQWQNQFPDPGQNPSFGQNNGRLPNQNPWLNNQQQVLPSSTPTTVNPNDATVQACLRNCPVTAEYNPVCGTNGLSYTNPGRLGCAQACGVNVSHLRQGNCPPPTTTAAPAV